jgi:hypothetical protein
VARIVRCEECRGTGAIAFEKGPAVERCTACRGIGVRFPDPATAAQDLRDALSTTSVAPELLELGADGAIRALAGARALLEERLGRVEVELRRRG